ncbi:MAG: peptidyl-prolyl cis-trans isomerase [Candidatus Accumulibacter sp.]|nr:peptidyl-prolyl cis-trans isomerase [Accumulibacter sp.]
MLKLSKSAASLFIGVLFSTSLMAAEKTFVTVNGVAVPVSLANVLIAEQKAQGATETPEFTKAVREEIIRNELLLQEAKKTKIDKNPAIAAQVETARRAVLISAYIQELIKKNPITDAQLKTRYNEIKSQFGDTEYKLRHILVESESEATAIIAELKKGGKFEEQAKKSIDQGSKNTNGDLGWNSPNTFLKPFGEALVKLKKGEYTETPVKTRYGYHVIQLDDTRPMVLPPFEEVKPRLLQQLQAQKINKRIEELREKAKIQ